MERSMVGTLGKRLVAYVVLIALAVVALKVVAGAVIGLVTTVFTLAALLAVVVGGLWLYRKL